MRLSTTQATCGQPCGDSSPLTALRWPRSVLTNDGGSEERLKTERVPSREAQASRLLSSLANRMVVTGGAGSSLVHWAHPSHRATCGAHLRPCACQRCGACHRRHSALPGWRHPPWLGWPRQTAWGPAHPAGTPASGPSVWGCGGSPAAQEGSPCSAAGSGGTWSSSELAPPQQCVVEAVNSHVWLSSCSQHCETP